MAGMATSARHTGRWTLEDRFASAWHYLPVEVPPGAAGLRVDFGFDRADGTVLDLGCLSPGGFRGWSGGARDSFVITRGAATPGYLPGELEAGTWQVMIGVHRVPPGGAGFRLTAEVTADPTALALAPAPPAPPVPRERPPRRDLPASAGRRWLAGDLHSHTVHSDGVQTVPELAALAVERGLDFIAVTDHNTISHHAELPAAARRYGITLLPGQEVTTDGGHAGALGDVGWIDFRQEPDEWLDATEAAGGLLSVNHPFGGPVSWIRPMRRRPPLLEVWHWSWLDPHWTIPLGWWLAWDPVAIPVGGSDWHRPGSDAPPGQPTTWVESAGPEPEDVLAGLRAGRVAISAQRDGPVLLHHDGDLVAVDADGTILAGPGGPRARVRGQTARLAWAPGPHRLLDATGATLALSPLRCSAAMAGGDALPGRLVEHRGGRIGRVQRARGAGDGDADQQVALIAPGGGQPGGLVPDQQHDGAGQVGVEHVPAAVLVGAGHEQRAAPAALGVHPGGHLTGRGHADHGQTEQRARTGPNGLRIVDVSCVPGHDDAVRAKCVRGPDDAADVAWAGRPVKHQAKEIRADGDAVQVVGGHPHHRHQLGRVVVLFAQLGEQLAVHRDLHVAKPAQHGPGPARRRAPGVVDQGAERPARLGRQRDRAHPLDQELPGPLTLAAIGQQGLPLLEPGVA